MCDQTLASGQLYSTNDSYREAIQDGRRFLGKTKCASIGMAVEKDEPPAAYVYSDEGVRPNFYMPLFERKEFFQTHQKLDITEINTEDNLHLVPRSEMKNWGFKRYQGLPVIGYIENEETLETVYDISGTSNYEENYIPEVHDSQVAEIAAEHFGITAKEAGYIYEKVQMDAFN